MHDYSGLKKNLEKQLGKLAMEESLNAGELERVHLLSDTIKNICKIEKLGEKEEGGYSNRGSYGMYPYEGYAYDDGYSGRRDRMGRFARDGYSGARYSRDESRDHMIHQIDELMNSASTEAERMALRKAKMAMQDM